MLCALKSSPFSCNPAGSPGVFHVKNPQTVENDPKELTVGFYMLLLSRLRGNKQNSNHTFWHIIVKLNSPSEHPGGPNTPVTMQYGTKAFFFFFF